MWAGNRVRAMGVAVLTVFAGILQAGEPGEEYYGSFVSLRKNAAVSIGGEIFVDFSHIRSKTSMADPGERVRATDFTVKNTTLRLVADVHPNVSAIFKFNLGSGANDFVDNEIVEEALIVMNSVGGSGIDVFTGMGRAPYGQDVTLGMIQSYHHAANHANTNEGRVFIVDPPADAYAASILGKGKTLPPMRPGQLDRAITAGAAYQWDDRWRVEAAMFQPDDSYYRPRLNEWREHRGELGDDMGMAGRVWFMPFEDLVLEASAVWLRSKDMGKAHLRVDLGADAEAQRDAYAISLGFDWRRGPWMVFGEYQHGWDWNFSAGHDTDTWQIGSGRSFGSWRLGAMAEGLRIEDKRGRKTVDNYYKLILNIRHEFFSGLFILAEYGHEWFRRDYRGGLAEKRSGDFFGVRVGLSF